jgi:hypothetical protein
MRVALLKDPEVRERIRNPASFADRLGINARNNATPVDPAVAAKTEAVESPPLPVPVPTPDVPQ